MRMEELSWKINRQKRAREHLQETITEKAYPLSKQQQVL